MFLQGFRGVTSKWSSPHLTPQMEKKSKEKHTKCNFQRFLGALSARGRCARQIFFSNLNSPEPGDEFYFLRESRKSVVHFGFLSAWWCTGGARGGHPCRPLSSLLTPCDTQQTSFKTRNKPKTTYTTTTNHHNLPRNTPQPTTQQPHTPHDNKLRLHHTHKIS